MEGQLRFAFRVEGTQFSNVRFVDNDYALLPNEREGWTEDRLPRVDQLPGFVPPVPPLQQTIDRRQFFQASADKGMISEEEALEAVRHGTIPPKMQAGLDTLPPDEKFAAEMYLSGSPEFNRDHPMIVKFAQIMGMPPAAMDDMWRFAATL